MTLAEWVDIVALAGEASLAVVSFARVSLAPIARPLGSFFTTVAAWSAAALLFKLTGDPTWTLVDHAISPFTPPLALAIALTFDGRRRELRALLATAYLACGALAAVSALAFHFVSLRPFIDSRAWTGWMLSVGIPTTMFALVSFVTRLQRSVDRVEVERVRLALAGFGVAIILGSMDVLTPLGPVLPSLGRMGLLIAGVAVALVSLRFTWFESPMRVRRFTYAVATTGVALLVYISVVGFADASASAIVMGTVLVTVALIVASRRWIEDNALRSERFEQLASLGRFSAQMAHDLKNPLAALKGAAQLLREDVTQGAPMSNERPGPSPDALVNLMLDEIDRLGRVVDTYGKLARPLSDLAPVDINGVVRQVVAVAALTSHGSVTLATELSDGLPSCRADADMLGSVIENLVRNGVEAMPNGGTVVIGTERPRSDEPAGVVVVVKDSGVGMDRETLERAFDDFYTTKSMGTGLGLAFVRRVVKAHGGEVALESSPGRGTAVRFRLPIE